MKVFPLALIVLASLLATVSTILFIKTRSANLRLESALANSETIATRLQGQVKATREQLSAIEKELTQLNDTRTKLAAAEKQADELGSTLAQTRNLLTLREQNEMQLNREIADLNRKLAAADIQATELSRVRGRVSELEQIMALLHRRGISTELTSTMPQASILGVGPENAFVVINLGTKQGLGLNQKLLVRRGTDIIATVLTSEVREDLALAQVEPSSLRTALRKGDSVLLEQ